MQPAFADGFALGVGGGWKRLSYDADARQVVDIDGPETLKEGSTNLDDDGVTFGVLGRWYGAIPNTGFRHYFGLEWWRPGLRQRVTGDFHPPAGEDDTGFRLRENWYARGLIGGQILALQAWSLWLFGGIQYTDIDLEGFTDESGGGGTSERFKKHHGVFSPVLGLEMMVPLGSNLNLGLGVSTTRLGDLDLKGSSSTFAFDYRLGIEDAWQTDATLRLLYTF